MLFLALGVSIMDSFIFNLFFVNRFVTKYYWHVNMIIILMCYNTVNVDAFTYIYIYNCSETNLSNGRNAKADGNDSVSNDSDVDYSTLFIDISVILLFR